MKKRIAPKKEKLQVTAKDVYTNVLTFVDVILGYLLSYFLIPTYSPEKAVVLTILITTTIIKINIIIASILAKHKYPTDIITPYSLLEKHGGDTEIITKEIVDMWNNVFDKQSLSYQTITSYPLENLPRL